MSKQQDGDPVTEVEYARDVIRSLRERMERANMEVYNLRHDLRKANDLLQQAAVVVARSKLSKKLSKRASS